MPDLVSFELGALYGLFWFCMARLAVAMWRVSERGRRARESREMVLRLYRWRDC